MANVIVDKNKIDLLANAIADKSGEPVTMTLDEMVEAVDGIEVGGGITPTGNIDITSAGVTDVTNYATATVPQGWMYSGSNRGYYTSSGVRKWHYQSYASIDTSEEEGVVGFIANGTREDGIDTVYNAIPTGTSVTPTESSQTIGGANTMMEGAVTVNAIPSNYVGSGITRRDSTDLSASGATVSVPSGYYENNATKTIASGSVNNVDWTKTKPAGANVLRITHNMSKTAGYITAGSISSYSDLTLETATVSPTTSSQTITPTSSSYYLDSVTVNAIESGTAGTPTATKGTVSNHSISVTPSVTNTTGYITGSTINGTAVTVSASELVSGTYTVDSSGTKDVTNYASANVPALTLPSSASSTSSGTSKATISRSTSNQYINIPTGYNNTAQYYTISATPNGTEGTPTATKGTVSNHSVTVTPSVTNTAGYISGGTKTGTAVTVSASELVSGSQTLSDNGTYDVTNLAEVVVDVQGGSSGGAQVATKTATPSTASSSIQFTSLSGNPTSFVVTSQADIATNTNGVTAVVFDGSSLHGQMMTSQVEADTGFTKSYSNGTLTITATSAQFQANAYKLVYTYGGSSSDIETADVQVGSGATSITFSVNGRPAYWSCIFKSDFSTSSGYQRVIIVANDGSSTYGLAMDSSAHAQTSWTASYSGGNFTINSQSTNNGGYFHQPGYYQLTYYVDASAPQYQTKSAYATTSAQTITADNGYDALEQVNLGAISQTNLTAANIKSGTTITISNGQSNLWSVTGTYEGEGGSGGTSAHVGTSTITNSSASNTSISFSSLSGTPIAFFVRCTSQLTRSSNSSYYYVTSVRYNGTNTTGNYWRMSNGTFYNDTSHYSYTYSNGTLTIRSSAGRSSAGGSFYNGGYELVYVYES